MRVSLEWLQTYFKEPLPATKDLVNLISLRSFEVEGVEGEGDETVIDLGVLPNRAHDCLGYNGIATEIAAIINRLVLPQNRPAPVPAFKSKIECSIEDSRCRRFTACEIKGVFPKASPSIWVKRLAVHASRSINAIVDATNMAMLETNQPTHAFDADKIEGKVTVRGAKAGERVVTLDGKDIELEEGALVIADDAGPLDLAGIKGGSRAGISDSTTRILLTSCNFDGPTIRKSSQRHNVRTDASKRFEGELAPELAMTGLESALFYISDGAADDDFSASEFIDIWPKVALPFCTGVSSVECSDLLGFEITETEIAEELKLIGCEVEVGVDPQERIVEVATAAIGKPYKYGASVRHDGAEAFDCSSLVTFACSRAGLSAPRMAVDQSAWAFPISKEEAVAGDLVFADVGVTKEGHRPVDKVTIDFLPGTLVNPPVDHVGILVGDDEVIHATGVGGGLVKKEKLSDSPQFKNISRYGRVAPLNETRVVAVIPPERLDLRRPEDLIEEVGRLFGYEHVPETPTPDWGNAGESSAEFRLSQAVRASLVSQGFSEVMTSSFASSGDLKVFRPQNEEKPYLRTNLADGFLAALGRNYGHKDWLEVGEVKSFEIGKVFSNDGEKLKLIVGIASAKKRQPQNVVIEGISELVIPAGEISHVEISLYELLTKAPSEIFQLPTSNTTHFSQLSVYPYAIRDVAVWVSDEGGNRDEVADVIRGAAGPLLVKLYCFDEFTKRKEGEPVKTSYAFRLILQAFDRTLSDTEIAAATDAAYAALRDKGWEIR